MKKYIIWGTISVVVLGTIFFVVKAIRSNGNEDIRTIEARLGTIDQIVSATGTVKSSKDVDLGFENTGNITDIHVSIGDAVVVGEELASLDTGVLDSNVAEAKVAVNVARAQLENARSGSTDGEIAVQQVIVSNAQASLAETKSSAAQSIASAQAQVDYQKIVLSTKQQALEDAHDAVNDNTETVYSDGLDVINSKDLVLSNVVDDVNDLFDDGDLINILGNLDYQSKVDAQRSYDNIIRDSNAVASYVSDAKILRSHEAIDEALAELEDILDNISDDLATISQALINTYPMVGITEAELDAYKTTISTDRTNINTAVSSVKGARQDIASAKITNTTNTNTAQAASDSAEALLSQYEVALDSTEATQQATVVASEGTLKSAEEQLKLLQTAPKAEMVSVYYAQLKQAEVALRSVSRKYSDRVINAPTDGVIVDIHKEEGEFSGVGEKVISMIAMGGFEIEVEIPESDIVKVNVGNPCEITLDAFSDDDIFEGNVVATNPTEHVVDGVVYYKAKIIFLKTDERIKPGMTAHVDILTERKENVIVLPSRLVQSKNSHQFVNILLDDGSIEEKTVEKGIRGFDGNAEILSGLEVGDLVVE
ncbi:HlyD family efflux transporter periplasmic adaptor subunit [bacterium]|nr:MAG: HlyD family efflux transporter periplasmic adaptor subunit [bacterium]